MVSPQPQQASLSVPEYYLKATETNRFDGSSDGFQSLRFGYFGEIGGLLSAVKKTGRDQLVMSISESAAEELGDALWYLINVAAAVEVSHNDLGERCIAILRASLGESEQPPLIPVTFRHIDSLIEVRREPGSIDRSAQLSELANAAGFMTKVSYVQYMAMPPPTRAAHFGKHLTELAMACASFNLKIEDVARSNLEKISSRWPKGEITYPELFDETYLEHERFPRNFSIDFIERGTPENGHVVQSLNGVFIGDRLTDNSNEPDDYRFHDVFHLAYVAFLGWSPVLRSLLKRKRKSVPKTDENEDGARAMIIEEGIATWIFNHAKGQNFYADARPGSLDYGLLKQIQSMVDGYEVAACKLWQWEKAILTGFQVFRALRDHRGGTVVIDMLSHTMSFEPLKQTEQQ